MKDGAAVDCLSQLSEEKVTIEHPTKVDQSKGDVRGQGTQSSWLLTFFTNQE